MMATFSRKFIRDEQGHALVEMAIMLPAALGLTFMIVELAITYFWWTSGEKAAQMGVRIAAVSDPVAEELTEFTGKTNGNRFGDEPMPPFAPSTVVCDGASSSCTNGFSFDPAAHARIVTEMNRAFGGNQLDAANVAVDYTPMDLGFVGRPGGPVALVTVRLQNMTWDWVMFDWFLGLDDVDMPAFSSSLVSEDLSMTTPVL